MSAKDSSVNVKVNEDLAKERQKCNFDIREVTHIIDGGKENTERRRQIEDIALNSGASKDEIPDEYLGPKEKYENAVRKSCVYARIVKDVLQELDALETFGFATTVLRRTSDAFFKEVSPFLLHLGMFVPTIMGQCTQEQQAYWLPRALDLKVIGTYAQTELGHGTFIRGLETTATYDPETEEFVLHSPTLTSYKWWAGGLWQVIPDAAVSLIYVIIPTPRLVFNPFLHETIQRDLLTQVGKTVNHCIVTAQLYIKGKCYGTHNFIVQIRDLETHMPLPGIKVGEIGPKMGFNTGDNGFLGFDNYRIRRENMAMKNAKVLKDGTYVPAKHEKLSYGTMVFVRVSLVNEVAFNLAKAIIIAVRYSAVRRQCQRKPEEPELQVLDYITQQHKLFICIATSHALLLTGSWLWRTYSAVMSDMKAGNVEKLPELHALSSCLKAVSTSDVALLIEQCRYACGGHGYMLSSNLPFIYFFVAATRTYEGDYTILLLQTARFLVKAWEQAEAGKPVTPTVSYLTEVLNGGRVTWNSSPAGIISSFEGIASGKISACVRSIRNRVKSGMGYEDAWQLTTVQLVAAAEAHCRAMLCRVYHEEVQRITATSTPNVRAVMQQLTALYLIYWSLERTGDLLRYTSIAEEDLVKLQEKYEELLALIRPNAVGLVDAFDIRDEILNSTLGAYDGRVYERLMQEALKSPLNAEPVNGSFHRYLKPFMQGKL